MRASGSTSAAAPVQARSAGVLRWSQYLLLGLAILGAALVAYHPHHNLVTGATNPFPVHMDEYVHWGYAKAVIEDGTLKFTEPFTGSTRGDVSIRINLHEHGYWLILGLFKGVTGFSWLAIYRFGPAVWAGFLALCVYCLAERELKGAGVWSAAMVACIPTTLRLLGPGFFVPIVFALPFVAGSVLVAFHYRTRGAYWVLALLSAGVWPIHAMGGITIAGVTVMYALFTLPLNWSRALLLLGIGAGPLLAVWDYYSWMFEAGIEQAATLPAAPQVFALAGYGFLGLAVMGALVVLARRGAGLARGMTLTTLAAILAAVIGLRFTTGVDVARMYDRSHMVLFLVCAVLAGVAAAKLIEVAGAGIDWLLRRVRVHPRAVPRASATLLVLGLVSIAVFHSAQAQSEQSYYQIMDEVYYADLLWIRDNVPPFYSLALLPDYRTMPFSILTGRPTAYIAYPQSPITPPEEIVEFYRQGGSDTDFLVRQGITMVLSKTPLSNPDLVEIPPRLYLLREDYARRLSGDQA